MLYLVRQLCLFVLLVFLQVSFFVKIHLFGVAIPLVYVYFILQLPGNLSRNIVFLLSVFMGYSIDILSNTWGLHLLSCVIVGFLRFYLLRMVAPSNLCGSYSPSVCSFGKTRFFCYSFSIVFLHQTILFMSESFSLLDLSSLIFRIIGSGCLTLFLIFIIEILIVSTKQ